MVAAHWEGRGRQVANMTPAATQWSRRWRGGDGCGSVYVKWGEAEWRETAVVRPAKQRGGGRWLGQVCQVTVDYTLPLRSTHRFPKNSGPVNIPNVI